MKFYGLSIPSLILIVLGCSGTSESPRTQVSDVSGSKSATPSSPVASSGMENDLGRISAVDADQLTEQMQVESLPPNTIDDLLLFFPAKHPEGNWEPIGLQFEDVWITTPDETRIHGWYCAAPNPRAYLLYAHGNAGNISYCSGLLGLLQRSGITTLAFDYHGYGRSEGLPSKDGIISDASAARSHLAELAKISESEVVLMGRSLGGAVVIQLAAKKPPRGLIIESTFSSLADIASYHFPKLAWLVNPKSLNSVNSLPLYHGPLLQSHGDADRTIPLALGQKLFNTANEPKQFVTIFGGDHNTQQSAEYYQAFDRFINSLPFQGALRTE